MLLLQDGAGQIASPKHSGSSQSVSPSLSSSMLLPQISTPRRPNADILKLIVPARVGLCALTMNT